MLLRSLLSATQLVTLDERGWLGPIVGSLGGLFAFGPDSSHTPINACLHPALFYQIWELSPATGQELYRWCILPNGYYNILTGRQSIPPSDMIMGIMLLVEADEAAFRATANCQWDHRRPPPLAPRQPQPPAPQMPYQQAMQALQNQIIQHNQQMIQQQMLQFQQQQLQWQLQQQQVQVQQPRPYDWLR